MAIESDKDIFAHDWILDSGCSRHMTLDRDFFTTITLYQKSIRIANGQRVYTEGVKNVKVTINRSIIKMSDIL